MSSASSVQCAASVQWCYLQAGTVLIVPLLTSYLSFLALLHFLPSVYTSIYQARYIIIITCSTIKTNSPFQCQPRVWRGRPGAPALAPTTSRPGPPSWTLTTGGRPSLLHRWRTYPETWSMSHQWGQFLKVFLLIWVWLGSGQVTVTIALITSYPGDLSSSFSHQSVSWAGLWVSINYIVWTAVWRAELFIFSMFRALSVMH